MSPHRRRIVSAAIAIVSCAGAAEGAYVSPDGRGQALIFPYYTVQVAEGGAFNTYVSIVNHAQDDKALRVRLRESRNGREVASFNLFLGHEDVWAAAIVPDADGARIVTTDKSCTDPAFVTVSGDTTAISFSNAAYTGSNSDGAGAGLDRAREGYIEVLEMGTVVGTSRIALTHTAQGVPAACASLRPLPPGDVAAPTGGIAGTLTLINVTNGSDFSANAEALSEVATRPFYRAAADGYPSFAAAEIDPVSVVVANGSIYRSQWNRGLDAVSAALMRSEAQAEYVLDAATRSRTDVILTFPTRPFLVSETSSAPPFGQPGSWTQDCARGEMVDVWWGNRAQRGTYCRDSFECMLPALVRRAVCGAAVVMPVASQDREGFHALTGSTTRGYSLGGIDTPFENGWILIRPALPSGSVPSTQFPSMVSLATSTRMDIATGAVTSGVHTHFGLPLTGVMLRTLNNGTLSCGSGACQGSYGSAFPLRYVRKIAPAT
jgi:hypothetical protein